MPLPSPSTQDAQLHVPLPQHITHTSMQTKSCHFLLYQRLGLQSSFTDRTSSPGTPISCCKYPINSTPISFRVHGDLIRQDKIPSLNKAQVTSTPALVTSSSTLPTFSVSTVFSNSTPTPDTLHTRCATLRRFPPQLVHAINLCSRSSMLLSILVLLSTHNTVDRCCWMMPLDERVAGQLGRCYTDES